MSTAGTSRRLAIGAGIALVALALAGCGKKGSLAPPEGRESEYLYPRTYPAPQTVVPPGGGAPRADEAVPETASPFSDSRETRRRYGAVPAP